jgi:hypothetical protein
MKNNYLIIGVVLVGIYYLYQKTKVVPVPNSQRDSVINTIIGGATTIFNQLMRDNYNNSDSNQNTDITI